MGQGKSENAKNVYRDVKNTALDILYHGMRRGDSASRPGRFTPEESVPATNCAGSRSSTDGLEKDVSRTLSESNQDSSYVRRPCLFTTPTELCWNDAGPRDSLNHRT